jgi:hypothetical protein
MIDTTIRVLKKYWFYCLCYSNIYSKYQITKFLFYVRFGISSINNHGTKHSYCYILV